MKSSTRNTQIPIDGSRERIVTPTSLDGCYARYSAIISESLAHTVAKQSMNLIFAIDSEGSSDTERWDYLDINGFMTCRVKWDISHDEDQGIAETIMEDYRVEVGQLVAATRRLGEVAGYESTKNFSIFPTSSSESLEAHIDEKIRFFQSEEIFYT